MFKSDTSFFFGGTEVQGARVFETWHDFLDGFEKFGVLSKPEACYSNIACISVGFNIPSPFPVLKFLVLLFIFGRNIQ